MVGVTINLTEIATPTSDETVLVNCGIDLEPLQLAGKSEVELSRIYELPANVTIKIEFSYEDL